MATLTDKRLPQAVDGNPLLIKSYNSDDVSYMDYSPFGMQLTGRVYNYHYTHYRYGFNGKENDNEMYGPYNELDYGMRTYDPRVGRFLSVDQLASQYAMLTPYQFANNSPIRNSDLDGLENIDEVRGFQARMLEMSIKTKEAMQNAYEQKMNMFNNSAQRPASPPNFVLAPAPDYTYRAGDQQKAEIMYQNHLRNSGYNEDATPTAPTRLMQNKTFNKFADNIALPTLDIVSVAYGAGELKALLKGLFKSEAKLLFKVDLMGGERSMLGKGWINYDLKAVEGIRADVSSFPKFFPKGSVSEMVVNNPQAPFLGEVSESLAKGSTITIRGQMANRNFSSIFDAKAIDGFEIISRRTGLSKGGYKMSTGAPLRGGENSINEIILKKK